MRTLHLAVNATGDLMASYRDMASAFPGTRQDSH